MLNNLLSNALKFTAVGKVTLEVLKTAQVNDKVELFFLVIDSGIGIDKADKDKFSQFPISTQRTSLPRLRNTASRFSVPPYWLPSLRFLKFSLADIRLLTRELVLIKLIKINYFKVSHRSMLRYRGSMEVPA